MKNKILALTLGTILALSSTTAHAAVMKNMNFNFNDFIRNYNIEYYQPRTNYAQPVETYETNAAQNNDNVVNNNVDTFNTAAKTTTQPTAPSANVSYEERVAQLVNVEREKNGLQPLVFDSAISNVARAKSKDMADNNYFAYQSPTYGSAGDMLRNFGISWSAWGENIASGQRTPEAVVNAWMNSEGHRANILSSNFGKIGIGYVTNSGGTPYWTQMFTN